MFRSITFAFLTSFLAISNAHAEAAPPSASDPNDAAYEALAKFTKINSKTVNSAGCLVAATADFDGYYPYLPTFRDAWLNLDYSVDFYSQRRKQVYAYTILKRFAELLTEGLYRKEQPETCSFTITTKYVDKFGQDQEIPGMTWKFSRAQNAKVNWDKIDPRNFGEIAIDLKATPETMKWLSDEPNMASPQSKNAASTCNMGMMKANAMFMRATTYCKRDYLDSKAGLFALEKSRECAANMNEDAMKKVITGAMHEVDKIARQYGRAGACDFVDAIEQEVLKAANN
jgi:hypothetical protein